VASNNALEQSIMGQSVDTLFFPIAGRGGKQQRKTARVIGGQKAPLQGEDQLIRNTDPHEPLDNNCIAIAYDGDGFVSADDLVLQLQSTYPHAK
jgi:hypothetical protein